MAAPRSRRTPSRLARGLLHALLLAVAAISPACAPAPLTPRRPVSYAALAAAEQAGPPVTADRIHALLLNGGGAPDENYASHLAHLRELTSMLTRAGVAPARISILSSDGDDAAADLAVLEPEPEDAWLLAGTSIGERLLEPAHFESSTVPAFALRPATLPELRRWFQTARSTLRAGDTLLLYVTDHGMRDADDVMETRIVLWGTGASVSVRELRTMVRALPRGVRVVMLMSQCFSGAFARLSQDDGQRVPEPNVCGYFSARHDREAYGCYGDLSGRDDQGHSFAFLRALARTGDFDAAHRAALVTDRTPDTPLRTSDVWLHDLLIAQSADARISVIDLIDTLLAQAWENGAAWEPEMRVLDSIGQAYGFARPRSVREMRETTRRLSRVMDQVQSHTGALSRALEGAAQSNLDDFVSGAPSWAARLDAAEREAMSSPSRRALSSELFRALGAFTSGRGDGGRAMKSLSERASAGEALTFRTEVRLAALVRTRALLTSIAGRIYLSSYADPEMLAAYRAMRSCERLTIPGLVAPADAPPLEEPKTPMPSLAEDLRALEELAPPPRR